ncbi:MAG: hypothetical protein JO332_13045 [Planctomycetaceae bacterium]|nr:hypothetical protein [Planctomycetaceae bacterium]
MPKPVRLFIGIFVGVLTATIVRSCLGGGVSVKDLQKHTVAGITAEFPGTPQPLKVDVPPEVKSKVLLMDSYQTQTRTFLAAVSRVVYAPGIEANLDGALDGSVSNVMTTQQMVKVSEQREAATVSGLPGKRFSVVFRKGSDEFEMQGVIATKGNAMWNGFAFFKKSDAKAREVAQRFVSSVTFTP